MKKRPSVKTSPDFVLEASLEERFGGPICGIDEAGRGPWAGPVVAAAVILTPGNIPAGLNDSKKLTANKRDLLFDEIMSTSAVGVGIADVARIDTDNILQASLWAMTQAVASLHCPVRAALVDGNKPPRLDCPCECVVKGDSRSYSIAAASIIAKVTRDRLMRTLSEEYPLYGWDRNKGYGTAEHAEALSRHGVTPHHRRSFKPVKLVVDGSGR